MLRPADPPAPEPLAALDWDVFCRVIDNHGDIGVCWRLARRLVALGQRVRLWVDDTSALRWMAPDLVPDSLAAGARANPIPVKGRALSIMPWRDPHDGERPADVVVEAFGCDPPAGFVQRMADAVPRTPVWINLEYLSAQAYALRSHGLPSPQQAGPGRGLMKWFFYPGFTAESGGLLHEDRLRADREAFDASKWLGAIGIDAAPRFERASLFCYEQSALPAWLAHRRDAGRPTQLLVTPGPAAQQVSAWLGTSAEPDTTATIGSLQARFLPWLDQDGFDRLLWACDLNFVRGEDSLVRALWARRPFVWQLYPQRDLAHAAKLDAFLDMYFEGAEPGLASALRQRFARWNGLAEAAHEAPPEEPAESLAWANFSAERAAQLERGVLAHGDLARRLCRFALAKR